MARLTTTLPVRFTPRQLADVDAVLDVDDGEVRSVFIRKAVELLVATRQRAAMRAASDARLLRTASAPTDRAELELDGRAPDTKGPAK